MLACLIVFLILAILFSFAQWPPLAAVALRAVRRNSDSGTGEPFAIAALGELPFASLPISMDRLARSRAASAGLRLAGARRQLFRPKPLSRTHAYTRASRAPVEA